MPAMDDASGAANSRDPASTEKLGPVAPATYAIGFASDHRNVGRVDTRDRMPVGVVYTTFHFPESGANVVTTENSDWATNCPEYKVTAVQVSPSNGISPWQEQYQALTETSRRIEAVRAVTG